MKLTIKESNQENKYQLLGRLVSDCKYYLGGGYGAEKHLWAKSVEDQIAKMKEIYNSLDVKPEWLTMQDIEHYEKEMKKVKLSKNESLSTAKTIKEQKADIEVENPGILEVPEGKNVEDLPIKHFVDIANRKGLSTVTRALNNLQVWNKNKNKSLSKWAGNMIDKVTKRYENQKKNESFKRHINESVDTKLEDIDYIMYNDLPEYNVEMITDNTFGEYEVELNEAKATVKFDLSNDTTAHYVFYINGEGPYETDSSERVCMYIKDYLSNSLDEEIFNEFTSNFDGTEIDEVEIYAPELINFYTENSIANKIESDCSVPINVYSVSFEFGDNIVIAYEVSEDDYNPTNITSEITNILNSLKRRITTKESIYRKRSCLHEGYEEDIEVFVQDSLPMLDKIFNRYGYRLYKDYYFKNINVGGKYQKAIYLDFDERYGMDNDLNALDKALYRYFVKRQYRFVIETLPRFNKLCIYY